MPNILNFLKLMIVETPGPLSINPRPGGGLRHLRRGEGGSK